MDLPPAPTPPGGSGGGSTQNSQHSSNLLNLLKFSGARQAAAQQPQQDLYQQNAQLHQQPQQQQEQQEQQQYQYPPSHHHQPQQFQSYHRSEQSPGFDQPPMSMSSPMGPQIHAPAPAAQDPSGLLRALMGGAHDADEQRQQPPAPAPAAPNSSWTASSPPEDTRTYLLNLLNRPKPSQHDQPALSESSRQNSFQVQSGESQQGDNLHHILEAASQSASHSQHNNYDFDSREFEQPPSHYGYAQLPQQDQAKPFSPYHGYEAQHTPSQNHTPKSGSAIMAGGHSTGQPAGQSPGAPAFHILKKAHDSPGGFGPSSFNATERKISGQQRSPLASPEHLRSTGQNSASNVDNLANPTPGSTASITSAPIDGDKERETVSEAIHDIAEKANLEAQEALARAEEHKFEPEYVKDLNSLDAARTEKEFEETAHHAAQSIKKELDREENDGILESLMPSGIAEEVHKIVDEAAAEGIADSWESADQDEIIVIEEEAPAPVKVFNFPMKPWISIAVQDGPERPQFRDESIMDIARLKKEFDQIDRNLYTATETYMVYGMPKAGGLRVIRQEDGRDAKIFTDTKDRIFNVAMSVTPSDYTGAHREAIIGTGVSGTVYWVQVRNGEKDHIEDAHPEQYGFALPPMTSHEGDAPGGVLKTRARPSTIHPEFFAVGRGKSINIVWPSYIMKNNLFKPGHDRVVDTDQLAKQCSLKINTGKAGKDFTFSQDDSVVVSLDKSGRVKFWDVRDLIAAKEDGESGAPTPAHTSLEVKDPMLTLTTTPEGEKAWPTSVLLVDKLRPYQKRCALRYMIVGMKQNHTLQLWDLALGKPVQEFNLPHSKESDAVCSVMYHPPTGMLVIGHPTRNSIYLAHLSAPKYNLKSVSQVEYIQRLVAQDTAIPQPDSTAVISGVREYSFANRGILRSLDILATPAMSQDSDEPTLFELYAMHSKGVACLLIKQTELGWSKDNKVLAPVDAVEAGVISISKLQPPAAQLPEAIQQSQESSQPVARSTQKDLQVTPSNDDASSRPRGPESATPVKLKQEVKDEEIPAPSSVKDEKSEKQERKGRKKKANAANAAALAAESQSNGGGQSPRVVPKDSKDSKAAAPAAPAPNSITQESVEAYLGSMESRLNSSFAGTINAALKSLHTKIEDGHRQREKDFDERQLKLLDMVSEVLNENTQKVLESLIQEQFTNSVIPAISEVATKAVADQFSSTLNAQVSHSVHKEIHRALPSATQHALGSDDFIKAISDRVASTVASNVKHEVVGSLSSKLSSGFNAMAVSACQQVADDMQRQHRAELEEIHAQRAADQNKLDQLSAVVTQLSGMVSGMASSQAQFQEEFLRSQRQLKQQQQQQQQQQQHASPAVSNHQSHASHSQAYGQQQQPHNQPLQHQAYHHLQQQMQHLQGNHNYSMMQSPEASSQRSAGQYAPSQAPSQAVTVSNSAVTSTEYDRALAERVAVVDGLIREGKVEDALLRWLQSGREQAIFDTFISKFGPQLLQGLPGLLLLTVATTICQSLDTSTRERIAWLEMIVNTIHDSFGGLEADAKAVTPKIFHLLITNTENLFVRVSSTKGNDPLLRNLSQMVATAKQTVELCTGRYG